MHQSSPHHGREATPSYHVHRRGTIGPLAAGARDRHLPLRFVCLTVLVSLISLFWSFSDPSVGFFSAQPTNTVFPKVLSCCLLVSFLKLSLDQLIQDRSLSSFRPPTFPIPVPCTPQSLAFLGCPASWSKAGSGKAPASHSSSMAQLASTLLLLFSSEGQRPFMWAMSEGWS